MTISFCRKGRSWLYPTADFNASALRANLKSKLKQFESALSDFNHAIALDSLYANAYIDKGVLLSDMGQHAAACSVYTHAILIDSTNSIAYGNRGITLSDLGNDNAAINDYLTAIRLNANNALYYNNLGNSYNRLGRYAEALEVLNQSLRLDPAFTKAFNNRATANWALGKYLASLRDRVLAFHSNKYSYLFYLYVIGLFLVFKRRKIFRLPLFQTPSHYLSRAYLRFRIFLRHL